MNVRHRNWGAVQALVLVMLGIGVAGTPSVAMAADEDPHAHHRKMMQKPDKPKAQAATIELEDHTLVDQHGKPVQLTTDIIGDRIVVVDFVYTTCTTVCPVLSAIMLQVQGELGDRMGREVMLVSISVDPQRDTPQRMNAYASKLHVRDGWTWLTGEKQDVDAVLKDFGVYTPNFEDHPATVLVGDGLSGEWSRFVGFPGAGDIMNKINEYSAARSARSTGEE